MSTGISLDLSSVVDVFPDWNYKVLRDDTQLLYKFQEDSSLPAVLQFTVLVSKQTEVSVITGQEALNLATIESTIQCKLKPVNHANIKLLLAYLDSLPQRQTRRALNSVLENFDANLTMEYPTCAAICRFCFCKPTNNHNRLEPITLELMRMFKNLTSIDLSLDAELPANCCRLCADVIAQACSVREVALKAEKKLIKFHKEAKIKVKTQNSDVDWSEEERYDVDNLDTAFDCDQMQVEVTKLTDGLKGVQKFEVEDPDDDVPLQTIFMKNEYEVGEPSTSKQVTKHALNERDGYK